MLQCFSQRNELFTVKIYQNYIKLYERGGLVIIYRELDFIHQHRKGCCLCSDSEVFLKYFVKEIQSN